MLPDLDREPFEGEKDLLVRQLAWNETWSLIWKLMVLLEKI